MTNDPVQPPTASNLLATSSESRWRLPNPFGGAPLRPACSVRRTTSVDVTWPKGELAAMHFEGIARDCYTAREGAVPLVLATDRFEAELDHQRSILAIESTPARSQIKDLVGARGGGYLRQALADTLDDELRSGTPLYQLLDDLSGTSLIANWAWSRWPELNHAATLKHKMAGVRHKMEGVCVGFRPGSSALDDASMEVHRVAKVEPLANAKDPDGWHVMPEHSQVSMRRARRIDVWLEGDIQIDAGFQDSATAPEGGRIAVHEYSMRLSIDAGSGLVRSVNVTPHILPFPECPSAVAKLSKLEGASVSQFRSLILETFPRVEGCTHLNDALRALADVPQLLEQLKGHNSE